jgi:PAS domain-containing protein
LNNVWFPKKGLPVRLSVVQYKEVEYQFRQIRVQADLVRREYRDMEAAVASLTAMLDSSGGFIWRKNAKGRYLFVNRPMRNGLLAPHIHAIDQGRDLSDQVLEKTDTEILSGAPPSDSERSSFLETNIAGRTTKVYPMFGRFVEYGLKTGISRTSIEQELSSSCKPSGMP